jgi:predicted nucleic acid-binding protein
MTIVDTTVWIDYFAGTVNPHTDWLGRELTQQRLGLTDLILCEILQGIRQDLAFNRVLRVLSNFEVFDSGGGALAARTAQNYRALRAQGHTVRKTIDCIIATFCLTQGHSLLHRDHDFDPFEEFLGLPVVHP